MTRPDFTTTIAALRARDPRYPWVGPTEDEADAADALEVIQEHHQPTSPEPQPDGTWGPCSGCDQPWPCPIWIDHEHLAVQWLGRAADRAAAHAHQTLHPGHAA